MFLIQTLTVATVSVWIKNYSQVSACTPHKNVAPGGFFAFIFQLSGWALVAPSCFALQVPE